MALDKIEAVSKATEVSEKQPMEPVGEIERVAPDAAQFDSLMGSMQPHINANVQNQQMSGMETPQNEEQNPIFTDENLSSQAGGSATDRDRQQGGHGKGKEHETEEIGAISSTKSKNNISATNSLGESPSLGGTTASATPQDIQNRANATIQQIAEVKEKLNNPNTNIKPSYQTVLQNHLSHIDDHLQIALSKVGGEHHANISATTANPGTPNSSTSSTHPAKQLMDMLSKSENDLFSISGAIQKAGGSLGPGDLLAIQLKVGSAQRQIEMFSSLISKAMEATKTVLGVQI